MIPTGTGILCLAARLSLLPLLFFSSLAVADWTGVSFEIGNYDADWEFERDTREAQVSEISFQIEERTGSGLAVGASIGYFDLRAVADSDSAAETMKFDGEFISIYLRQPLRISEHVSLNAGLSIRYTNGRESGDPDESAEIDWTESAFELGLGIRFGNLRLIPYAAYHNIDGDISDDGTDVFELEEELIQGLRFDYFVEDSAFIRLEFVSGGAQGGYINFVRRY
jgi:hypothetical protein